MGKKIKGLKWLLVVDTMGPLLAVVVHTWIGPARISSVDRLLSPPATHLDRCWLQSPQAPVLVANAGRLATGDCVSPTAHPGLQVLPGWWNTYWLS